MYMYDRSFYVPLTLIFRWFPEVQNIFYQGNKRKLIPLGRLEDFFNSVAVLMTNLLRELALNSIRDYLYVFCPPNDHHIEGLFPGFILNVVLNGTSVEFEPNAKGFEIVVLNAFDKLLEAASSVPRVETKLYPNESSNASKPNLKPIIDESVVKDAKAQVPLFVCVFVQQRYFMTLVCALYIFVLFICE